MATPEDLIDGYPDGIILLRRNLEAEFTHAGFAEFENKFEGGANKRSRPWPSPHLPARDQRSRPLPPTPHGRPSLPAAPCDHNGGRRLITIVGIRIV
jgi:hypothetical protein